MIFKADFFINNFLKLIPPSVKINYVPDAPAKEGINIMYSCSKNEIIQDCEIERKANLLASIVLQNNPREVTFYKSRAHDAQGWAVYFELINNTCVTLCEKYDERYDRIIGKICVCYTVS